MLWPRLDSRWMNLERMVTKSLRVVSVLSNESEWGTIVSRFLIEKLSLGWVLLGLLGSS